jgi:hypothetical protein
VTAVRGKPEVFASSASRRAQTRGFKAPENIIKAGGGPR